MFDFENLFVLDLANNHQGDLLHGKSIIEQVSKVVRENEVRGAIKFQFRQLKTFIHTDHLNDTNHKQIIRFKSTELSKQNYQELYNEVKKNNLLTMCTPFDEASVDIIVSMGFDIIKVASCSAKDWPLLEKVSETNLPIIISTGGLDIANIDDLVSFFNHRGCHFSIMHCVSIYPTSDDKLNLNQIDMLKKRYPDIDIGWSTHEDPDDIMPVTIAIAKGAKIFERHVGKSSENYTLNAYSSNFEQIDLWIKAAKKAIKISGSIKRNILDEEVEALNSLKRGVYIKNEVNSGEELHDDDVYFAIPYLPNQLDSGKWSKKIISKINLKANQPILLDSIELPENSDNIIIKKAIHEAKAMLSEAKIHLNSEFEVEYSHHYGIKEFRNTGVIIINVINREYCKKILIQLPNQKHPSHHHKLKEETFHVLSGKLNVKIDGKDKVLYPGDTCLVLPGVWHSFFTEEGCIFEEISTTHFNNDSVYKDKRINDMKREDRKTIVNHWGRYQINT